MILGNILKEIIYFSKKDNIAENKNIKKLRIKKKSNYYDYYK